MNDPHENARHVRATPIRIDDEPGIGGIAFLAFSEKNAPMVSKIMLTGYAEVDLPRRAVDEGEVRASIEKPAEADVLGRDAAIRAIVPKRRGGDPS
jgi:FixJ family two-component response regulator